tara:strand:+ start:1218 stop:1451 length:234 start_codon:yes stop_codon:yes gene_type:complete
MKMPRQCDLTHMQLQAMLREHSIPESELLYSGERKYTTEYAGHPEYHGQLMHWYIIGGEHEVPVCDIQSVDRVDDES